MIEQSDLISVVIPTYNRADRILATINSALNQTYRNIEVIIVDDASTDNTEEIVQSINDKRVNYYKLEENSHGTRPRNFGIEKSKGKYIAFLDSDDIWISHKLDMQKKYIEENSKEGQKVLCFTNVEVYIDHKTRTEVINDPCIFEEDIVNYIFEKDNFVQTSTFMLEAKIAKRVKFNPSLKKHQDYDFCIRLQNEGIKFLLLSETLTTYFSEKKGNQISSFSLEKIKTSMDWFQSNTIYFNDNSKRIFIIKNYIYYYMLTKQKYLAFKITLDAYRYKMINLKKTIKIIVSMFLPKKILLKRLK
ncbi:glycosyltransferase family 2 protein [Priestia endophytica]|uniref:glycosyltransferase family 2 protein n=1 Tax=Priestia endophytica TaxID=135735 RepID=UPI003D296E28